MKNKKIVCITWIVLLVGLLAILYIIYLRMELDDYIRINTKLNNYSKCVFVINNSQKDNISTYNRLFHNNVDGVGIYAVDCEGNAEKIIDLFDCELSDMVVVDNRIKVLYYHYIDGKINTNAQILEVCLEDLKISNRMTAVEVIGFDKNTGEEINRKEKSYITDWRSNSIIYETKEMFVDGKSLLLKNEDDCTEIAEFDMLYNYVELMGTNKIYAICSENYRTKIKRIDMNSRTVADVFQTSENIIETAEYEGELYILFNDKLLKLTNEEVEVICTTEESSFTQFDSMLVSEELLVFGNNGYQKNGFEIFNGDSKQCYSLPKEVSVDRVIGSIDGAD